MDMLQTALTDIVGVLAFVTMEGLVDTAYTVFGFLLILTVLVFVHEMGHFAVARWNGVKVEVFSIGFGREIFGWTDKVGTRWKFCWVPLGGYVKMLGDTDPASAGADESGLTSEEREHSFHSKRLSQRAAIVFAGPAINYVFAVVLWALLFAIVGETVSPAKITVVYPQSAAEKAGILPGDEIVKVDGESVDRFEQVERVVRLSPATPVTMVVLRDGKQITLNVTPASRDIKDNTGKVHRIGFLGVQSFSSTEIAYIGENSAALRDGLKIGDTVVQVNGKPVISFEDLRREVEPNPGKVIQIKVRRDGNEMMIPVTPMTRKVKRDGKDTTIGRIGVGPKRGELRSLGPIDATMRAVGETIFVTKAMFKAIGQIFAGTRTAKELAGPIKIAQMSGKMAQGGAITFLGWMAFISLNLCIINLLPIPILDGGHLMYYAIEALRGKPLGQKAQEYGFRIGLALVLSLMVFVTWNDVLSF